MSVPQGIDIIEAGDRLVIRAQLLDSAGNLLASGAAAMRLYELQDDGTLKSFDFNDNTFKTTALTTETAALTHRTGDNGTADTGIWTGVVDDVTGFVPGRIYMVQANHVSASPPWQTRQFQFGGGDAELSILAQVAEVDSASVFRFAAGISTADDWFNGSLVKFVTGALRHAPPRRVMDYTGATRQVTTDSAFPAAPSVGDWVKFIGYAA